MSHESTRMVGDESAGRTEPQSHFERGKIKT